MIDKLTEIGGTVETTPTGCRVLRYSLASKAMDREIRLAVVVPADYDDENRRYPVVYALHGMGAPYDTFANMTRLHEALTDRPMIVVCHDGDEAGWYIDATERADSQFETFFFEELIGHLETEYRTDGRRGLVGFSMGGYGAMRYALRRPELFCGVCTLSAAFRPFSTGPADLADTLEPLIGSFESAPDRYAAIDVLAAMRARGEDATLPAMMLRCGTEDFLLEDNRGFVTLLVELNAARREADLAPIDFRYIEQPGSHDWPYWHAQAPEFTRFLWDSFAGTGA